MTPSLMLGDVFDVLPGIAENSVDAVVTDPPYGLEFMGKEWDRLKIRQDGWQGIITAENRGQNDLYAQKGFKDLPEFRSLKPEAMPAMQAWHFRWAREVLRVLKPGGHLVAFGGSRTYHRLACAVEDAGFEMRDQLQWLYGSGFPKSLDVSKAIDKAAGEKREVVAEGDPVKRMIPGATQNKVGWIKNDGRMFVPRETRAATPEAAQWDGWGTALKPAHEPILLARKPLSEPTIAKNVLRWGTGALNIDSTRIAGTAWTRNGAEDFRGGNFGVSEKCADLDMMKASHTAGRWPANVVLGHHPECVLRGTKIVPGTPIRKRDFIGREGVGAFQTGSRAVGESPPQEVEDWACHPECPVRLLDEQGGKRSSHYCPNPSEPRGDWVTSESGGFSEFNQHRGARGYDDTGGASRFFYTAKADSDERGEFNRHPTVKPIALMRWLCRLVTPTGGLVLDCFMGSGSTGVAALAEGFGFVGIEREPEYFAWAERRIAKASASGVEREGESLPGVIVETQVDLLVDKP